MLVYKVLTAFLQLVIINTLTRCVPKLEHWCPHYQLIETPEKAEYQSTRRKKKQKQNQPFFSF